MEGFFVVVVLFFAYLIYGQQPRSRHCYVPKKGYRSLALSFVLLLSLAHSHILALPVSFSRFALLLAFARGYAGVLSLL